MVYLIFRKLALWCCHFLCFLNSFFLDLSFNELSLFWNSISLLIYVVLVLVSVISDLAYLFRLDVTSTSFPLLSTNFIFFGISSFLKFSRSSSASFPIRPVLFWNKLFGFHVPCIHCLNCVSETVFYTLDTSMQSLRAFLIFGVPKSISFQMSYPRI